MKHIFLTYFAILCFSASFGQQFAGTGKGKFIFGSSGNQQEYRSTSVYSNMSFFDNTISFHFKTSTFSPYNNSDPQLIKDIFEAGQKTAMEFAGALPDQVKHLGVKEICRAVLKGRIAYGSVKKNVDIPVKVKRLSKDKYELISEGQLSLSSLGISNSTSAWKKANGSARFSFQVDIHSEM